MIHRHVVVGGSYAENFPDGSWYALVGKDVQAGSGAVTITLRNPFQGDALLGLRAHPSGQFAGQGHTSGAVIHYDGRQWIAEGTTCGVNSVCFAPDGTLVINDHCQYGTQGIRWIEQHGAIRIIHTGDETYDGRGTTGIAEWTRAGNVVLGQSYVDGCTVRLDGDVPRQLEPGHCTFVRVNRDGDRLAVAMWKQLENRAVLFWLDVADIASLPQEPTVPQPQPEPEPEPEPEPQPEPTPMKFPDNIFATLKAVRAKYPADRPLSEAEIGAILNETAWIHRAEGAGLQRKDSGTSSPQPQTGIRVWRGMRVRDEGFDVCGACTVGRFDPVQATGGPADPATFVLPVKPDDTPEPEPDPDPVDPEIVARVVALEALAVRLVRDCEELKRRPQGTTEERVRQLIAEADHGGEAFDPAQWKTRTRVTWLGTFDGEIVKR